MLLIHVGHKEEEEGNLIISGHLGIVVFVERIITQLIFVIKSMVIPNFRSKVLLSMSQVVLMKLRHNQEVALMLQFLVPIFLRRSMINL